MRLWGICLAIALSVCEPVLAADQTEIEKLKSGAMAGDYTAQRNLAYLLRDTDKFQGCIWRGVILFSGYSEASTADIANLGTECGKLSEKSFNHILELAEQLSNEIYAAVPPKTPGLGSSIYCKYPPNKDDKEANELFRLEEKAFTGNIASQRKLAEFLEKAADPGKIPVRNNLKEDACAWRKVVIASSVDDVSAKDKIAWESLYQSLSPQQQLVADHRANRIYHEIMKRK